MRRRAWLTLLLSLAGWGCASEPPDFVYAIGGAAVSAYRLDPGTGALRAVPGSPFTIAGSAFGGAAVAPSGRFLYVGHRGAGAGAAGTPAAIGSVSAHAIGARGELTPVPGSPFPAEGDLRSLTVAPTGRFLYAVYTRWMRRDRAVTASHGVSVYAIHERTGGLALAEQARPPEVLALAIEPAARFAYGLHGGFYRGGADQVLVFGLDATTGELAPLSPGFPIPTSERPDRLLVTPSGRLLLVLHATGTAPGPQAAGGARRLLDGWAASVSAYAIDPASGGLAPMPGAPTPVGSGSFFRSMALTPSGRFAYVVDEGTPPLPIGSVWAYRVDEATGELTEVRGSPGAAVGRATAATVDRSGRFLYVTNAGPATGSGSISAYRIDPASGALTPVPGAPFPAAPASAAIVTAGPRR